MSIPGLNTDQAVGLLKFLSQTHRSLHDQRRKYEAQAFFTTLTFFAILGAAPFIDRVFLPSPSRLFTWMVWIAIAIIAIGSSLYLYEIHKSNGRNKRVAESAESQIRQLLCDSGLPTHPLKPRDKDRFPPTFIWQSAMIIMFGIAAALLLTYGRPVDESSAKLRPSSEVAVERAAKPAGKGIELYSWKPASKDWHFSLLLGTNRNKALSEIKDPKYTVVGTQAIEEKLSRLAEGENVVWWNLGSEPVPKEIVHTITQKCRALGINLVGPYPIRRTTDEPGH